ncbi:Hypothetical protein GLP15_635 [Giardia lamblia P15]|uniref:WD-repeat family protein n=1 Tax=Giardia intestinalis (strain P15) TaxID=658858 RepID=E1F5A1_GIAIA|nr:Hypothetical protein GLP15_635 [Giardia lamblia P15]
MQIIQSPEKLIELPLKAYTSFCVAENICAVIGGHEAAVHVRALPRPFTFRAGCQNPQACILSTLNCLLAVVYRSDSGFELGLFSWSLQSAREAQQHESRLTKKTQVPLSGRPVSGTCLAISNDEAFLICILLNDVLIYAISEDIFVYASSFTYINRQDNFFSVGIVKQTVSSSGIRLYAGVLGCKNQSIAALPFTYSREDNSIIVGEFRSLLHLSFVPMGLWYDKTHIVAYNDTNITVIPYKQTLSTTQNETGLELSLKLFSDQQIPLGYFFGANKIFTAGLGQSRDSVQPRNELLEEPDVMLATTLFVDTDVGVFGVPTNSLASSNVALAERDDQDPESLEMCLARECKGTYSVLSSVFEWRDGCSHFYIIEASNRKLYLFHSRMVAIRTHTTDASLLTRLSIGYSPKPKAYDIIFDDFQKGCNEHTWFLPTTSVLNLQHPRIMRGTKSGAPSVPARSSQAASSSQAKRTASTGTVRIAAAKVKSSGYSSSIPWSEQQKLKQEKLKQEKQSKQKQLSLPNDTSNLASLGKEEDFLKRYSRLKQLTVVSTTNPIIYAEALDDGTLAYLSSDNCISLYTRISTDKGPSLKLKMSIVPSTRITSFSTHVSSQLLLTPGLNASLGMWRAVASNRKELLSIEPRKASSHETTWCSFIWPRSDTEGLCLGAANTSLYAYRYDVSGSFLDSASYTDSAYTELAVLNLPSVIYGGACFTRFKSPACFLTHSRSDKNGPSDTLSVVDVARMKKVATISSEVSPHIRTPSVFLPDLAYTCLGSMTENIFATSASGMTAGEVALYDVRQTLAQPIRLFNGVSAIKANPRVAFLPKCNGLAVSGDEGRILIYDIRTSGIAFDSSTIFRARSPTGWLAASSTGALIGGTHDGKLYAFFL